MPSLSNMTHLGLKNADSRFASCADGDMKVLCESWLSFRLLLPSDDIEAVPQPSCCARHNGIRSPTKIVMFVIIYSGTKKII